MSITRQRLAGASLLVLANKQDLHGSMNDAEIQEVRIFPAFRNFKAHGAYPPGLGPPRNHDTWLEDMAVQCSYWGKLGVGIRLGRRRRRGQAILQLSHRQRWYDDAFPRATAWSTRDLTKEKAKRPINSAVRRVP